MPRNQRVFLPGLPAKGEQEIDHSGAFIFLDWPLTWSAEA